jgi:DNA-directed RNA polymerase subunit RPC12/RpoP
MISVQKYKAKCTHKGDWWIGYYVYSGYTDKHFIVQNATENIVNGRTIGMNFAHWAEIDPETLQKTNDNSNIYYCDQCGDEIHLTDLWKINISKNNSSNKLCVCEECRMKILNYLLSGKKRT